MRLYINKLECCDVFVCELCVCEKEKVSGWYSCKSPPNLRNTPFDCGRVYIGVRCSREILCLTFIFISKKMLTVTPNKLKQMLYRANFDLAITTLFNVRGTFWDRTGSEWGIRTTEWHGGWHHYTLYLPFINGESNINNPLLMLFSFAVRTHCVLTVCQVGSSPDQWWNPARCYWWLKNNNNKEQTPHSRLCKQLA